MNADRLLAYYERIADAPNAITRLRQFILDLAVRGKLVPQIPQDEPTSKPDRALPAVVERPFDIPTSWHWSRLRTLGTLKGGGTPSKARDDYWNGGIPWVSPKDMKADYLAEAQMSITSGAILGSAASLIEPGSVLFVVRGMILAHSFPVALTRVALAINQDMKALVLKKPEMAEFILRVLKGLKPEMLKNVQRSSHGTCRLEGADYANFLIPIPPAAEQNRIISKVDDLMALCDQLETVRVEREATRDRLTAASLARLSEPDPETFRDNARFVLNALPVLTTRPDQIKRLRQTIINLAVRGRLVRQNRNENPVSLPMAACEEQLAIVPATWRYVRLANLLAEDTRNGYSRRPDDAQDGTPILRISAGTSRRDGVVAEEEHKLISAIDPETRNQYGLNCGDLLACRFNGNRAFVGRLTIFRDYLGIRPIYPDKLIRIRTAREFVLPEFLRFAGQADIVRGEVEAVCATTVGNWGISATNLKEVRFPVPPIAEQHRIVAKVDELMALCDRLEASLLAGDDARSRLLDALLHEVLVTNSNHAPEEAEKVAAYG